MRPPRYQCCGGPKCRVDKVPEDTAAAGSALCGSGHEVIGQQQDSLRRRGGRGEGRANELIHRLGGEGVRLPSSRG